MKKKYYCTITVIHFLNVQYCCLLYAHNDILKVHFYCLKNQVFTTNVAKKNPLKIEWENCYEKEKVVELLHSTLQM